MVRNQNRLTSCNADLQDKDCFYAAVFEKENPSWKSLPLAVQQKQIIVTCNYEARRRGLYKLQLVQEAKKKCPDMILVLGEDLTRFRDASKDNYNFLRGYSWNNKVERLGFDEVSLWTKSKNAAMYIQLNQSRFLWTSLILSTTILTFSITMP